MTWKVLVTARTLDEVGQQAVALLKKAGCELVIPPKYGPHTAESLLKLLPGNDAVLASMDKFTAEVLGSESTRSLKHISRWGVGYDAIDVPAATKNGVIVTYVPGLLNETVADFAFALLLAVARRVHLGHAGMTKGVWEGHWGHDVHGKTLGILGCGRIGMAMARRSMGFNMRLLAHDICANPEAEKLGIRFVSLDELLAESDFVSLHAALTAENRGLLNEARLRKMKPTAYLINTARGALIDEAALAKILNEDVIAGAAIDAYVVEPLPDQHPLRSAKNILLTPHLASWARETGERVSNTAAQAIVDVMQGRKPQLILNPDVYKSPALRMKVSG